MNSYCASIFNWALSNSIHIARTLSVRPAKAKHQNRHQKGIGRVGFLNKFQTDRIRRDQRAVCFAARAVRRPCPPLDDARSASQTARSSRACMVQDRRSGRLPSAARRRALRSGFVPLDVPLRLRSTCPARRPQTEASFIAEAGVTPGAIPLVAPIVPVCGQLPPPARIPWATWFGIPARAFCIPSLPLRSAPVRRFCRCRESNLI